MPSRRRRVYVDFDDVLCATARGFLDILSRHFGKTVAFEEITDFDLGRSFGLAPAELDRFFELVHEDDALARFEPLEGALDALSAWRDEGCDIEVVTGRPLDTRPASEAWLETHEAAYDELVFVAKYDHAPGGISLDEIVARDYDWVVEDSFLTAERLALGGHRVCLLDRPWNRIASNNGSRMLRCANWSEVRASVRD